MKLRIFIICVISITLLQSCDWAKKQFGMPTKKEIAEMKVQLEDKKARILQDSIDNVLQDTTDNVLQNTTDIKNKDSLPIKSKDMLSVINKPSKPLDKQYYLVMGSFKNSNNANNLIKRLEKLGYKAEKLLFKKGYEIVALGFGSYKEAVKELQKVKNIYPCPDDIWIYNTKNNLHK